MPKMLGPLCKRNHDHDGSGQSLWYTSKGRRTGCVRCAREVYDGSPEEKRAKTKAYRDAKPEYYREMHRKWYQANREEQSVRRKAYREANADRIKAQISAYQKSAVGKRKAAESRLRRLQALLATPCTVTDEYLARLLEFTQNKCPGCGCEFTSDPGRTQQCWDHDVPITMGGADSNENIIPLCRSCNSSKRQKTFEQWKGRPFLRPE